MDDPFSAQIYQAQQQQQQHKAAASSAPLKKPPKWLRRPCGATFAVCVENKYLVIDLPLIAFGVQCFLLTSILSLSENTQAELVIFINNILIYYIDPSFDACNVSQGCALRETEEKPSVRNLLNPACPAYY